MAATVIEVEEMPARNEQDDPLRELKDEIYRQGSAVQALWSEFKQYREDSKPLFKMLHGNGEPGLLGTLAVMQRDLDRLDYEIKEMKEHGTPSSQLLLGKLYDQSSAQGKRLDVFEERLKDTDAGRHQLRNDVNERFLKAEVERAKLARADDSRHLKMLISLAVAAASLIGTLASIALHFVKVK